MWGSRSAFASVGLRAAEGLALLVAVSIALVLPGQLETSGPPKPATSPLHRLTPSTITVAASPSPAQPRKRQRLGVSHRPPGRVSKAPAAAARVSGRPDHHNTGTNPAAGPTEPGRTAPPAQTPPTPAVTAPAPSSPTASPPPPTTTTPPATAGAGPSNPVPTEPQASTPTDRPGWGHGDTNHPHTGPPGQPPPTTTVQVVDVETQAQPGNGQNAADDSPARRGRG
jgi:hypothetical protein